MRRNGINHGRRITEAANPLPDQSLSTKFTENQRQASNQHFIGQRDVSRPEQNCDQKVEAKILPTSTHESAAFAAVSRNIKSKDIGASL